MNSSTTEQDAERAVRAALDLVAAVSQLGLDEDVPQLAARAGVVTGPVAVTLGAAGEGMVAGDAVNTAARVQTAAGPGQVLADEATQRLAGRAIGFAGAGERVLKGKAGPQRLWRATRVLSAVGGSPDRDTRRPHRCRPEDIGSVGCPTDSHAAIGNAGGNRSPLHRGHRGRPRGVPPGPG
jgi:class 3 adenylate cyclase